MCRGNLQLRSKQILLQQGLRMGIKKPQLFPWLCLQSWAMPIIDLSMLGR
jgi:hypothetical protein